ncbi:MAG: hypothetical protein K6F63_01205 [Lachnospiraceae bacterium]|nr:hypothetical protein [Lachnospiraceae bacterium]
MKAKNDALMWLEKKKFASAGTKNLILLLILLGLGTACTLSRLLDPDIALTSIWLPAVLMCSNKVVNSFYDAALKPVLCMKKDMRQVISCKLFYRTVVLMAYPILQAVVMIPILFFQNRFDPQLVLRTVLCMAETPLVIWGFTVTSLSIKEGFRVLPIIAVVLSVNVLLMAERFNLLFCAVEVLLFTGVFFVTRLMISKLTVEKIYNNGGRI